jgi:hypothetical protein
MQKVNVYRSNNYSSGRRILEVQGLLWGVDMSACSVLMVEMDGELFGPIINIYRDDVL